MLIVVKYYNPTNTNNSMNMYYDWSLDLMPTGATLIRYNINSCTAKLGKNTF